MSVALNARGEVADFVDESQFEGGESAYECVAFNAALCHYAGQPGHGPTGTGEAVDQLADVWYAKLEGSAAASNTNGMSLQAEYTMLGGIGLQFVAAQPTVADVKVWLSHGYPLILCGAESGMHDLDLGGAVPYAWTPTGNHAIIASGIAPDGNLLVRDTASIAPTGVRPGPRRYDASKLQLVSATVIALPWLTVPTTPSGKETSMSLLTIQAAANYFDQVDPQHWKCKQTGFIVQYAILQWYCTALPFPYAGLSLLGIPTSNETPIPGKPGAVLQRYERAAVVYDPKHLFDQPPGMGDIYLAHIDPLYKQIDAQMQQISQLTSQNSTLQQQLASAQQHVCPVDPLDAEMRAALVSLKPVMAKL